ncbi:coiled-coil domain-containing protein 40-like [Babylonia areolata]|uniref:coiled-coil domain-containing protein 40-like n=1 Tax=Babylonia areolata TaxID=304850 RepID=UPI003FD2593B
MADEENREPAAAADTTAENAPTDNVEEQQSSSRPQSAASQKGSRPTSATAKPSSRPTSATAKPSSRPTSATAKPSSRPTSASAKPASRPGSAKPSSRPSSAVAKAESKPATPTEERPASAVKPSSRPASAAKPLSRPGSGRPASTARPDSARQGSRPPSVTGSLQGSRAGSVTAESEAQDAADDPVMEGEGDEGEEEYTGTEGMMDMPPENQGVEDLPPTVPDSTALMALPPGQPGGGGDGDGGDDDDDDDDDEEDEEEMEDSDDGSENETEMVVLDPDHPLMKRFQAALKSHLLKQDERLMLELRELDESLKTKKKEREELGVELYGVQQELARYQMNLERMHDQFTQKTQQRQREEQQLREVRSLYKDSQLTFNKEKKKGAELQGEVENLALRLFYMDNAKEDVRSDIAVMRRAAEKVESEVSKAEAEKQKQDLYVDRLIERVDKLKEEMAMYEAQIIAQSEETRAAKDALMEAYMEMEAIGLEKKQLYQQWNSSLIGMRRRDEAHAAMQEALYQQEQKILSLETEMDGYKKSIQKEQEQNEKLTLILAKTERDIDSVRKQLTQCNNRFDALKAEYTTYTRMLHETEQALNRASADKTLRENELNALRKQIEREYQEKVSLEDQIMERLRTQLTLDKAAQYSKKLTGRTRDQTKNLEAQMAEVENDIARDTLDSVNVLARVERLGKVRDGLDTEIGQKNAIINRSEQEIHKRNAVIERKQNLIDQYNKKLEAMISAAGGVELGPLEIQINSLVKSLDVRQQEIGELQQLWLRQQSELVRLCQDKDTQSSDVEKHKRQLTILSQKKIRTENEIDGQRREIYDIDREVRNMQNDVIKLNTLLHQQKKKETSLEQNNILTENDFIGGLKEAETESIELSAKLEAVKEEKERLLNSLVEAERQIMLWEKKTQLARETRAAVDSEVGQGEIKAMKAEIHRMTVRYTQLMKMQEKMIQDMEKAVSRRDTIVTRGDAQGKMKKKVLTKGTFERQMAELRKKIKTTIQDANECDTEIKQLRDHQGDLSRSLEEKQVNCQTLQGTADTLDGDIEQMMEVKQKNMTELVSKQQRMKYFQQAKEGRYTMLCRTDSAAQAELDKQEQRTQALSAILDRLNQEFPHTQPTLRRPTLSLSSRFMGGEDLA